MSDIKIHLGLDGVIGYREKLGSNSPSTASVATLASIAGVDGLSLDCECTVCVLYVYCPWTVCGLSGPSD